MKPANSSKIASILAAFALVGLFQSYLIAADPQTQHASPDFSHVLPFKVGSIDFDAGDSITITQIHGTTDTIIPGGTYKLTGTYHMVSHDQAMLSGYVTATNEDSAHSIPGTYLRQDQIVNRGDGDFTIIIPFTCKGSPHLSFYPTAGGSSFVSVYFGNADSAKKQ
jgi:hypothetical protein